MIFTITIGVAYAMEGGIVLSNGVTDFSGRSYDIGTAAPEAMEAAFVESSHAGGFRAEEPGIELFNGATNFSGRTNDTLSDLNR